MPKLLEGKDLHVDLFLAYTQLIINVIPQRTEASEDAAMLEKLVVQRFR
jgi:hypothetical protein